MASKADLMLRTELALACIKLRHWARPPSDPSTAECFSAPSNRLAFYWRAGSRRRRRSFKPATFRVAKRESPASPLGSLEHHRGNVG